MPESMITYFGQPAKVCCDGNCAKAWGISSRQVAYEDAEGCLTYLGDDQLGTAPIDPGTYEGSDAKPTDVSQFPNKWCVRECERCAISEPGEYAKPLEPKTFPNSDEGLPKLADLMGLFKDSPVRIGEGWESTNADDESA